MSDIIKVKNWILNAVLREIVKTGKLKQILKVQTLSEDEERQIVENADVSIHPIGTEEAFMMTRCYRIKIKFLYQCEEYVCALMAKKTPLISEENYEAANFTALFQNEIKAYTLIIPALQKLYTGPKDLTFPKYFYSELKEQEAAIVLGDFSVDGWKLPEARVNLSLEHILLGVEYIGRFHGLGYALKATRKEKFDALIELLKDARFEKPPPPHWASIASATTQRITNAVNKFAPQIPSQFLHKLLELLADNFIYSKRRLQPIEPYATLCHGDFLRNNIAFAYGDKDNALRPTDVMMFDFQTLRYCSPMVDLCLFLSLSAGKDVRPLNFNQIFDAYHQRVTNTFAGHVNGELPEFLRKSNLLKEYIRYLPYSLGIASYFLSFLHVADEMSQEEMLADDFNVDEVLHDTLTRGGDVVDLEIASLTEELYNFTVQEDIDLFEEFAK